MPDRRITVFTGCAPRDCCSLCKSTEKPFHFENRPTGPNLAIQRWPYCGLCWMEVEAEQKRAADPHVLAAWAKFLNLIERRENQAGSPVGR